MTGKVQRAVRSSSQPLRRPPAHSSSQRQTSRHALVETEHPDRNGGGPSTAVAASSSSAAHSPSQAFNMSFLGNPPRNYRTPPFPSLNVHTLQDHTPNRTYTLYRISDAWKFTVLWTLITYIFFHLVAVSVAFFSHGFNKGSWRFLWAVPIIYLLIAGLEAVIAGSIVGLVLGAVYKAGYYEMNTWIPCTWGFINVLVLIISSFSVQGLL
ncbi:Transmembrane protein 170 [Metarhizium album ARSEF 1941]|uniref:Transmembrane protein 170 n=1 Tax=Metarhizium album (strain ARSEF 1941) TaxID=1081103 RepID=A0A0B2X052_METAS|nr:Transmembrane protein 170 [Metarhizium album ARSEF 1941]KHN99673.1 Transmembrane protein 170 [Metarhizium album ARSEF 1941]